MLSAELWLTIEGRLRIELRLLIKNRWLLLLQWLLAECQTRKWIWVERWLLLLSWLRLLHGLLLLIHSWQIKKTISTSGIGRLLLLLRSVKVQPTKNIWLRWRRLRLLLTSYKIKTAWLSRFSRLTIMLSWRSWLGHNVKKITTLCMGNLGWASIDSSLSFFWLLQSTTSTLFWFFRFLFFFFIRVRRWIRIRITIIWWRFFFLGFLFFLFWFVLWLLLFRFLFLSTLSWACRNALIFHKWIIWLVKLACSISMFFKVFAAKPTILPTCRACRNLHHGHVLVGIWVSVEFVSCLFRKLSFFA